RSGTATCSTVGVVFGLCFGLAGAAATVVSLVCAPGVALLLSRVAYHPAAIPASTSTSRTTSHGQSSRLGGGSAGGIGGPPPISSVGAPGPGRRSRGAIGSGV